MVLRSVLGVTLAASVVLGLTGAADAQSRKSRGEGQRVVTACSIYGNGCKSVPVRHGQFDDEFRLPGGTWMRCKQSCKDTLRREVIDFWETLREESGDGNFQ